MSLSVSVNISESVNSPTQHWQSHFCGPHTAISSEIKKVFFTYRSLCSQWPELSFVIHQHAFCHNWPMLIAGLPYSSLQHSPHLRRADSETKQALLAASKPSPRQGSHTVMAMLKVTHGSCSLLHTVSHFLVWLPTLVQSIPPQKRFLIPHTTLSTKDSLLFRFHSHMIAPPRQSRTASTRHHETSKKMQAVSLGQCCDTATLIIHFPNYCCFKTKCSLLQFNRPSDLRTTYNCKGVHITTRLLSAKPPWSYKINKNSKTVEENYISHIVY